MAIERGEPLLFDLQADPGELHNLANAPEHAEVRNRLHHELFAHVDWAGILARLAADRERVPQLARGRVPSPPNQYHLAAGRVFDAEESLYGARWLPILPGSQSGGIIPQQFG